MQQIEVLNPLIQGIEAETSKWPDASADTAIPSNAMAMHRSAGFCRESIRELTGMVDDLRSQIYARKKLRQVVARVKIVLKKKVLLDLERRLQKAVMLLSLAQHSYTMFVYFTYHTPFLSF